MKKLFALLALLFLGSVATATVTTEQKYLLNNKSGSIGHKVQLGTLVQEAEGPAHTAETILAREKVAVAIYTTADGTAVGTHSLGVTLPDNAIVTKVVEDVTTHFTSTGSDGTIKLVLPTDGDLSSDQTMDGSNVGVGSVLPSGTPVKLTAARALSVTIATKAVTAGAARWFVYYVESI